MNSKPQESPDFWHYGLFQLGHHLRARAKENPGEWIMYQLRGGAHVGLRLKNGNYTYLVARVPKAEGDEQRRKWRQELAVFANHFGISEVEPGHWSEQNKPDRSIATRTVSEAVMANITARASR